MNHKSARQKTVFIAVMAIGSAAAQAELLTNYDTWTVDRYAPNGFANIGAADGRTNVLEVKIAGADKQPQTFENTQGKGTSFTPGLQDYAVVYGSLYAPASWQSSVDAATLRTTALWGTANNSGNPADGIHYPIVGFTNAGADSSGDTSAGTGRIRVWDSSVGWVASANQPVQYDAWNNVCMVLTGGVIHSYVNGALAYTQTDLSLNTTTADQFSGLIVNTFNYGNDYSAHWSNVGAGKLTSVAASTGADQSAVVGAAFTNALVVEALDASGAPLPCVPITFTVPGSGASATLSSTTVMTDYTGRASITATANNTAGSYAVTATAPGLEAPATLALTNTAVPVVEPPTPVVQAVPTLGEWSLMLLGLLAAGMGMRRLKR